MKSVFISKTDHQWVNYSVKLDLKGLHLILNKIPEDIASWYTINLKFDANLTLSLNLYSPVGEKHKKIFLDSLFELNQIDLDKSEFNLLKIEELIDAKTENKPPCALADLPFQYGLSTAVIEALSKEENDTNSILALSIYMHFVVIKSFQKLFKSDNEAEIFNKVYNSSRIDGAIPKEILIKKYSENEHIINEIWQEVSDGRFIEELSYLSLFSGICDKEMYQRRFSTACFTDNAFSFWGIPDRINMILGLGPDEIQILYYFLANKLMAE